MMEFQIVLNMISKIKITRHTSELQWDTLKLGPENRDPKARDSGI